MTTPSVRSPPSETPPAGESDPAGEHARGPRPAEGIELIGEYEGSGFIEAPYIARRADGQVIQLTKLLYLVAAQCDGSRDKHEIARRVSAEFGRKVSAGNVEVLVVRKLRPLGVLAEADGSSPDIKKPDQLLALKFRTALVPERFVGFVTTLFKPLFLPPIVVAVIAGLIALDVWLFGIHGIGQGVREAVYQPWLLLVLFGSVVVATAFHECGHASACAYGGAKPGVLGAGIYVVWPVFYCDVTDAYRLGKAGRLRTDLGGIYFNAIFALAIAGLYALTSFEPLLLIILLQHFAILQQLMPLLRLDGYYVISDLTGVPDILGRIRPILRSLLPGRKPDDKVRELKPWVRVTVSIYVLTLIPLLMAGLVMMIISAPRVFATAYDSLGVLSDKFSVALDGGEGITVAASGLQMAALVLPCAGFLATSGRLGRRLVGGALSWSEGEPVRRGALALVTVTAVALAAFTWWPNGEYKSIQPAERGTVVGGVQGVGKLATGRPSLTTDTESDLGGAPSVRDTGGDFRRVRQVDEEPKRSPAGDKPAPKPEDRTITTPAAPTETPSRQQTTPVDPATTGPTPTPTQTVPAPTQTAPVEPETREPTP